MEVRADGLVLTDALNVYGSRSGVFIPLGEFARTLDFPLGVFPENDNVEGQAGSPLVDVEVDLRRGVALIADRSIMLAPGQAFVFGGDIFARLDLAEILFGLRLSADINAQSLNVLSEHPLPFQIAQARATRAAQLADHETESVTSVTPPYALFTAPAIDVHLGGVVTRAGEDQTRNFDVRLAGDLAYGSVQAFMGSDDQGEPRDVRITWDRKDPGGRALGRLGGTRAGFGDVYTPSLAMGASGATGRGIFYTSAPLDSADLATPLDLRGELRLGEDVELYVNEVLRAAQSWGDVGRYAFLDVPLTFGLNTIRLVFYGPQGQRREEVRRINIGAGQVPAGDWRLRLGAVQQDTPLFDLRKASAQEGKLRVSATADYGLSATQTVSLSAAHYAPLGQSSRMVGIAGFRSALNSAAIQADAAFDDNGGSGVIVAFAARPFGVALVGRHAEFFDGFADETRGIATSTLDATAKATDVRADITIARLGSQALPFSLDVAHTEQVDGDTRTSAEARTSARIDRYYVSTSLNWEHDASVVRAKDSVFGTFDVSTLINPDAHFRAGLAYKLDDTTQLESAYADVDYVLSERNSLRFSAIRTMGAAESSVFQLSGLRADDRFDLSVRASWEPERNDLRLGLQIGFGLFFDPFLQRYRPVRSGVSTGGSVAFAAFRDDDGDGLKSPGEAPVEGVQLQTPQGLIRTDRRGQATGFRLGDGASVVLTADTSAVDDPFLAGGPLKLETVPRPGRTTTINYPMQTTGEIEITVQLRRPDGDRALAAVDVILTRAEGGVPVKARSDFAGVVTAAGLRPGSWMIQLEPTQALNLGLTLDDEVRVTVPTDGGFVRAPSLSVRIKGGARS